MLEMSGGASVDGGEEAVVAAAPARALPETFADCTDDADRLDWLCRHTGATYTRGRRTATVDNKPVALVLVKLHLPDESTKIGAGETTAAAVAALAAQVLDAEVAP